MSVDIFGLMDDIPSTTIQPIHKYALNLDDLENVEGFDEKGKKDGLYGFKLAEKGIYHRHEINLFDNDGIEKKPVTFVYEENKWIPIPLKYEWDIDIKLKPTTVFRNEGIMRILNSGTIMGVLISRPSKDDLIDNARLLRRSGEKSYCISSSEKKEVHLYFDTEHSQDKNTINNPPVGSTIIIEGKIRDKSEKEKEILPGLLIASLKKSNYDFKIIIFKEDTIKYQMRFVTSGLKITQVENKTIGLSPIKIHDFYYICRIRLTTQPVSDNEIKYL